MKLLFKILCVATVTGWFSVHAIPTMAAIPQAPEGSTFSVTRIIPDTLDNQIVYPAVPHTLELDPLTVYRWEKIILPEAWTNTGYYVEIWDANNRPIPHFAAQRLLTAELDISSIDPTLHPKIRIILFRSEFAPELNYTEPLYYQYHTSFNTQLVAFAVVVVLILTFLLGAALHFRIGFKQLVSGSLSLLRGSAEDRFSPKGMVISGVLILIWSGWFGLVLGTYVGGIQVFYLLIKTPFMLLVSLIFSILSIGVLSLLLGVKAKFKEVIAQSLASLAAMSLALAAFTPIILFYILLPQNHDQLLISTVAFFTLSGVMAAFTVYTWVRGYKPGLAWLITLVWMVLYGMVVLQLGWLLRPWVGVIDPIHGTVPFSRFYSGNVFIELIRAVLRLNI